MVPINTLRDGKLTPLGTIWHFLEGPGMNYKPHIHLFIYIVMDQGVLGIQYIPLLQILMLNGRMKIPNPTCQILLDLETSLSLGQVSIALITGVAF